MNPVRSKPERRARRANRRLAGHGPEMSDPLRLWSDNPTALDLLGFADIAAPVVEAIDRERLDPVAVGIFGDWGSGKTTILEILNSQLEKRDDTIVVYTRPWEYDPMLDARATLIEEVLERLRKRAKSDQKFWEKAKEKFDKLASRIRWSKAITLAARSAVTFTLPSVEGLVEIFGQGDEVVDPTLKGFREEFSKLLGEFTDVRRVVVLVDDLDRCLPDTVVMTMEAIKLFLSVEKMAFVVAADELPVKLAIARHFDRDERGTRMAADYLEKIVQIPISVPSLGREDTEAYLGMMLLDQHLPDEAGLTPVAEHCAERRRRGEAEVFRDFPDGMIPASAGSDLALAAELAPVLFARLEGNPRRLKRFLNAFWVRADIAARRGIDLEPPVLAKLMVLERMDEDGFGQILDWLGDGTLAKHLKEMDAGEADAAPGKGLEWWAELPPKLGEVQLEPYLRLAASLRRRSAPRSELRADLRELLDGLGAEGTVDREKALKRLDGLPDSDKRLMAQGLTEAIRRDPSVQAPLSEAVKQLLKSGIAEVVSDLAVGLRRIDASRVEPALILSLESEGGPLPDEIRGVIKAWSDSGDLSEMSRNAAEYVSGGAG